MGQPLDPVEPDVAEGDPIVGHRHGQLMSALSARVPAHLEDVRAVGAELEVDRDVGRPGGVVDDLDPLRDAVAADQPLSADPDRPADKLVERMHLGVGVAIRGGIRHLDPAPVVRADRRLQQHGPDAADAQHGAGEHARVAVVEAQPARIGVDVAERVGQQEAVPVLEYLHGTQVGGLHDRDGAGGQVADARGLKLRHRHPSGSRDGRPDRPCSARRSSRRGRPPSRPAGCGWSC